jgi:hypothetical protein
MEEEADFDALFTISFEMASFRLPFSLTLRGILPRA